MPLELLLGMLVLRSPARWTMLLGLGRAFFAAQAAPACGKLESRRRTERFPTLLQDTAPRQNRDLYVCPLLGGVQRMLRSFRRCSRSSCEDVNGLPRFRDALLERGQAMLLLHRRQLRN